MLGWVRLWREFHLARPENSKRRLRQQNALSAEAGRMSAKRAARTVVAGRARYVQLVGVGCAGGFEGDRGGDHEEEKEAFSAAQTGQCNWSAGGIFVRDDGG